jgi:hypothetical protein
VIPPSLLTPLVFPTFSGGFRNGAGIGVPGFPNLRNWRKRHWTPALRAAGLERDGKPWLPVPYVLRHTFATWALEAIDAVGSDEAIDTSLALVADRDRIVTLVAATRGFELGLKVLGGAPGADPGTEIRRAAPLELARLAEAGDLRVRLAASYPLAEAAAAHRALATGHTHGKIVLVP